MFEGKKARKIISLTLLSVVILIVVAYALFQVSKMRSFQFFGGLTNRVETDAKVVALTFDDAPTPHVQSVIDLLAEKDVKATFFMIGQSLERDQQSGEAIVQAGHELGNHTFTHHRMVLKSWSFIASEIEKTNEQIRAAGYEGEIFFRPPNGKKLFALPLYLREHNIRTIMWDVEPDTYKGSIEGEEARADFIARYTVGKVRPGSIILVHPFCDSCGDDRASLGKMIDELRNQGYSFVTISELLNHGNNT